MSADSESRCRLTVAMIVRNDSDPLRETLASIGSIADEIVVVDTGSTDDSMEVAKLAGATVCQYTWSNDFAAARNHCYAQATGDWVLWLDCGETLTPTDAEQLRGFVDAATDRSRAYMMLVVNPEGPNGESAEQIGRIRLVPRERGIRFAGRVRESMTESLNTLGIVVDGLPSRIHRGQREHDPEVKLRRARRDLVLGEQELKEAGADPRLLLTLGEALRNLGKQAEAGRMFEHALNRAPAGSEQMLEAYYGVLTTCGDGTPESLERQLATCLEASDVFPLDAQLLCAMGGFLVQQGKLELGVRSFETALSHGQVNPLVHHLVEIEATAAICAASALISRNEADKARAILTSALERQPGHATITARLAELNAAATSAPIVPGPMGMGTGAFQPASESR